VVAYLGLFAALATGGAYAADKIGSSDISKNAVKSKHIGKKQVKASDIKPGAAQPRAIALVDHDGANPFFNSRVQRRGFTSVVEGGDPGIYCIRVSPSTGLDPGSDPPLTVIDYGTNNEYNAVAVWDSSHDDCEAGEYEIYTIHGNSSTIIDNASFVIRVP
jgi:hypothetical protein